MKRSEGRDRLGDSRAHPSDWHQGRRVRESHTPPPVDEDQPPGAASFLDEEVNGDSCGVLRVPRF